MSEGVLPLFAAATIELSEVWDEDSGAKQYVVVKVYGEEVHRRRADSSIEWVASQARADGERAGAAKEQQRLARESRPARLSDIVGAEEAARLQRVDREHEEAAQRSPSWTYGPQIRHHRQRRTR